MAKTYGEAAARMRAGERFWSAWSTIPSAELVAELARGGFPLVVLDMQHAGYDFAAMRAGVAAAAGAGATAGVRVPVDAPHEISRALDQGAEIVVVPMVNTPADARRAVAFAKYPPLGERSWGPVGATAVHGLAGGGDYLAVANEATALLVMIETRQALDELDAILAVDGVDGVFVGPSDLSISLSGGRALAPAAPETMETVRAIGERARAAGKLAGVFCLDPGQVAVAKAAGFSLIALGAERAMIRRGVADLLASAADAA